MDDSPPAAGTGRHSEEMIKFAAESLRASLDRGGNFVSAGYGEAGETMLDGVFDIEGALREMFTALDRAGFR